MHCDFVFLLLLLLPALVVVVVVIVLVASTLENIYMSWHLKGFMSPQTRPTLCQPATLGYEK